MRFLVPIDLAKNELQNARVQNVSSDPSGAQAGQIYFNTTDNVLKFYDGSNWVAAGDISTASINALSDVTITSVADRDFLVYDADSTAWINSTIGLDSLDDVDTSGASAGQALVYDGQSWAPATIAFDLAGLADVTLVTPSAGEVLYFDGEDWVNRALDTDDVAEGSNLYYTDQRVEDVIAASTTDDLSEGSTNLYYTDQRVEDVIAASTTDDIAEGTTNLYYTDQRADDRADGRIAAATTDDLSEGSTNLYFTDERVQDVIEAASIGDLADVDLTGLTTGDALVFDGEDWVADNSTYERTENKGQADGYAPLGADGKLPNEFLPDLAITQTFVVADIEERDALEVEEGDVAVVTGTGQAFIFSGDGEEGQWILLAVPGAAVLSVTGTAPISSTGGQNPTISLNDGGVTEAKLADGAVSETKLNTTLANKINAKTDKFSALVGDGTSTSFTLTHNLGTRDVQVHFYEAAAPYAHVIADTDHATTNTVTVKFAVAPAQDEYRVVVVG